MPEEDERRVRVAAGGRADERGCAREDELFRIGPGLGQRGRLRPIVIVSSLPEGRPGRRVLAVLAAGG